ncbi:MAG: SMC family ATPase [Dehalococcoidia bacterium]|nr:SMC family ATPase [Dehalococcoidia bacterium]
MKIRRIDIEAFGCLSDFSVDVAPGLHVFFGPNEAGKSTLRRAILALLYGFYAGDRARPPESALRQRDTPWSDTRYAAKLEYTLQDGREFRVDRNFMTPDVPTTLWDIVVGRDMTQEFGLGRHGNVPFMTRQLGMTKAVFEACAFVSHAELFEIAGEGRASPQEIGDTIVSLADTGRRDVSAQSAIDRLNKVLKEQVGGPTARTTPLPVARNKLKDAQRELDAIEEARAEVAREAEELDGAKEDSRKLREEVTRTRYLVAAVEAVELRKRLDALRGLAEREQELQARLSAAQAFATFPAEERDRVLQRQSQINELRTRVSERSGEVEAQRGRLAELGGQKETLSQRRAELSRLEGYPVERKPEIERLMNAWRSAGTLHEQAQARLAASTEGAEHLLPEHEALEGEVGRLTQADRQRLLSELQAPAAARPGGGPGATLLKALVWLLLALPRLALWIVARLLRRTQVPAAHPGAAVAFSGDAAEVLQKHSRYLEIAPIVRQYREEQQAAGRSAEALGAAASRLREALAGLVDDAGDLEAAYAAFCERAALAGDFKGIEGQLAALESERRTVAAAIGEFERDQERAEALESLLRQELEAVVGVRGTLEEMVQAFEEGCRQRSAYDEAKRGLAEVEEKRAALLSGRSVAEWEEQFEKRERDIATIIAEAPHLEGAQTDERSQALRDLLSRQRDDLQDLEIRIAQLETAIDSALKGLRPRAEVEEEIEGYYRDVESLDRFGKALTVAIETIEKAMNEAHRDFAPRVGRLLGDGLARVTDGRYVKAFLDPATFRVTTEVPETGRLEDVEKLSQGTRAAAYLLLRVGLAQHMSSLSEPAPLILDDPLVDLDDMRLATFLELLLSVAEETQILLFTKDEATRSWFEANCAGNDICKLTLMSAQALAAAGGRGLFAG